MPGPPIAVRKGVTRKSGANRDQPELSERRHVEPRAIRRLQRNVIILFGEFLATSRPAPWTKLRHSAGRNLHVAHRRFDNKTSSLARFPDGDLQSMNFAPKAESARAAR